jgi:hypothetical protein
VGVVQQPNLKECGAAVGGRGDAGGQLVVGAGVGSQDVAVSDVDVCPLPDDPVLAEIASALRDAGHWAEIVDPDWRIVYSTEEFRGGRDSWSSPPL